MVSFSFESRKQADKINEEIKYADDLFRLDFMPNDELENRFILIISKRVSAEGIWACVFSEKELLLVDVGDDSITLASKKASPALGLVSVHVFFQAGKVIQLSVSDFENEKTLTSIKYYLP
ncbi:MAG: hypothetical protein ACKO6Q_05640 [Bacteroidota bacterium]